MVRYHNILVIQTAFLGDAILATSLVETLHAALPGAKISVLVRKGNESIYHGHPFLSEVLVWNKDRRKLANLFSLVRLVRKRKFDCVVNGHRYASSGLVAALSGARHVAGFKENPFSFMFNTAARHRIGDGRHETERLFSLVSDFVAGHAARPKLHPSPADHNRIAGMVAGEFVCLAPASVWFTKQLPEEKWVTLIAGIDPAFDIFLIGAPGDHALCGRIRSLAQRDRVVNLAGGLSLLESAALMSRAKMNFVNDSAPLHIASAVNAPVTAFFCSTVPGFGFGPLSDDAKILGVEDLPCRPCGLHGYSACPLGHFKCGRLMPLA